MYVHFVIKWNKHVKTDGNIYHTSTICRPWILQCFVIEVCLRLFSKCRQENCKPNIWISAVSGQISDADSGELRGVHDPTVACCISRVFFVHFNDCWLSTFVVIYCQWEYFVALYMECNKKFEELAWEQMHHISSAVLSSGCYLRVESTDVCGRLSCQSLQESSTVYFGDLFVSLR